MKNWIKAVFIFVIFSGTILFPKSIEARSGCCSHHGGVCGCGCCDGTGLSSTCAPYYPNCGGNDTVVIKRTVAPKATSIPKSKTTSIPTKKPTLTKKLTPTATLTPTTTPTLIPTEAKILSTVQLTIVPTTTPASTHTPIFWQKIFHFFNKK